MHESRLTLWLARDGLLDRLAIALSGLCMVHCIGTAVLLGLVSAGGSFFSHAVHEVGLTLAIGLGLIALTGGIVRHRRVLPAAIGGIGLGVMAAALAMDHSGLEAAYTVIGVGILAFGHMLNIRAVR
ncbi:MerC domain-containing protein [Sphingomonas flavalba]|uniref:MerC domain-containing protein n=1 Tax=Sphingomonas flavalba TaxID=2559804 RepID=UPI00109DDAE0|nr:MerC domain-containing protein [Sphingomonas flavalba]